MSLNSDNAEYKGLEDTRTNIEAMLNEEIESGTSSNKIILAGFSQLDVTALGRHRASLNACLSRGPAPLTVTL